MKITYTQRVFWRITLRFHVSLLKESQPQKVWESFISTFWIRIVRYHFLLITQSISMRWLELNVCFIVVSFQYSDIIWEILIGIPKLGYECSDWLLKRQLIERPKPRCLKCLNNLSFGRRLTTSCPYTLQVISIFSGFKISYVLRLGNVPAFLF